VEVPEESRAAVKAAAKAASIIEGEIIDHTPTVVKDTLCVQCGGSGTTHLMLTVVPFFREIVLAHFLCDDCRWSNTSIDSAGDIADKGVTFKLEVSSAADLNRSAVKSQYASISVPALDFEIPPEAQRGSLNTIQGFLLHAADDLDTLQEQRREANPEIAAKIDEFLAKLRSYAEGEVLPFTVIVDDPAGCSFVQPVDASGTAIDRSLTREYYNRTAAQNVTIGLRANDGHELSDHHGDAPAGSLSLTSEDQERLFERVGFNARDGYAEREVIEFETPCSSCAEGGQTRMVTTEIPMFKEVVIMSFSCETCGWKSNEVKTGGGIAAKGRRITLRVENEEDLSRDVLKGDTAAVIIPHVDLNFQGGNSSGRFTTIEGLISQILRDLNFGSFVQGDAADRTERDQMQEFLDRLGALLLPESMPWELTLEDPLANVYIQHYETPDPQITTEDFERSWEDDEELGLHDIDLGADEAAEATTDA
jgi:zinc finger protein